MAGVGWFFPDDGPVGFDAVMDVNGYTWQAFTDPDGVLVIQSTDPDLEVFVDRAIVDGHVYPAWVDADSRLMVDLG
ncbi:hypothetical protein ACFV3E_36670 [Streptomyces sp. NPDC059718]